MGLWNRGRGMGRGTLLVLSLCIAVTLVVGFYGGVAKDSTIASAATSDSAIVPNSIKESLPLLISLGQKATRPESPLRLVLKWQGEYSVDPSNSAEVAEQLATELGLGQISHAEEDGHKTYRSATDMNYDYTHLSMFWSEIGNGRSYVIVTLETMDLLKAVGFQSAAEEAGVIMQEAGIAAEWNVSLQGVAQEQGTPKAALLHTEQIMTDKLTGIKAVESYDDITTNSRSYVVPGLERFVNSANHSISAQVAIHKDGNQDINRVTIGFPLITIEY